jgi:hypothetical protein
MSKRDSISLQVFSSICGVTVSIVAVMNNPPNSRLWFPNCKEARLVDFVGVEKTRPGVDPPLPAKCSVFPLLFGAEHYQSLETALTNVG